MKLYVTFVLELKKIIMQSTAERKYDTTKKLKVERVVKVRELNAPIRKKPIPKSMMAVFVWLAVCALWIFLSQLSGGLFFEQVVICSIIISCVLFFKAIDSLSGQ